MRGIWPVLIVDGFLLVFLCLALRSAFAWMVRPERRTMEWWRAHASPWCQDLVAIQACSCCGAAVGHPCTNKRGQFELGVHVERIEEADAVEIAKFLRRLVEAEAAKRRQAPQSTAPCSERGGRQ